MTSKQKYAAFILLFILGLALFSYSIYVRNPDVQINQSASQIRFLNTKQTQNFSPILNQIHSTLPQAKLHQQQITRYHPAPTITPTQVPREEGSALVHHHSSIRGIYVSAYSLNSPNQFKRLLHLVDSTDLNAMVIDLKTDLGQVTYPSHIPLIKEMGANSRILIPDLQEKLGLLKNKHIYTIARIVTFKDPYLGSRKKDFAIMSKSGSVWRDNKGIVWVDPYKERVWDYNIQIAKEAAELGFDEIQFDYVRFPENGRRVDLETRFENPKGWTKAQVIEGFLKKAKAELGPRKLLSVDVFGFTTSLPNDMGIGQDWFLMSKEVDIISPMLYPSHYSKGTYGLSNPNLQPYAVIQKAVTDAKGKNDQLFQNKRTAAKIRPWFQDFTASWVKPYKTYGFLDVKEQIKAAHEQGIDDFLLWNANCSYSYR